MAWLEANRLLVIGDYHRGFATRFSRDDVTAVNLHSLRKRKGWVTGRTGCFAPGQAPANKGKPHPSRGRSAETQFRKGCLPHNTRHLGDERLSKDGYVEISIAETNPYTGAARRFVQKHRWLWEQVNGKVPSGHALKCLDSNRLNTDPSNWEAVPRAVLARLNGGRHRRTVAYDDASAELKPIVMAAAKLKHRIGERRRATPEIS